MKQANFATFTIITFILVLAWMGFNIYHTITTSSISAQLQQDIKPIDGTFDQKTITDINKRTPVQPIYGVQSSPSPSPSPSPLPSPLITPVITQATTAPQPTISPGGTP